MFSNFLKWWLLKSCLIAVLILFFVPPVSAESDSVYIAPFSQELFIGTFCYSQLSMLNYRSGERDISYLPNSPVGLGVSFAYKGLAFSGKYAFDFMRDPAYGKTRIMDFQTHYYGQKLIVDLFFQNYKGLYTEEDNEAVVMYPDMKITQYGLNAHYVFNHKKFSYRAAFNQNEQQKRSAGSFQVGGGVYYNKVEADALPFLNEKNSLSAYQLNLNGGYVYTLVFKENYRLLGGITVGACLGTENLKSFRKIEVSPSIFPRIAFGYQGKDWSMGLTFVMNNLSLVHREDLNISLNTSSTSLFFVKRIDMAPRFIRKIKILNSF